MAQDLYDQAEEAVEVKPEYSTWGLCCIDMFEAVWEKGQSAPERFDPQIHDPAKRFIRGEIAIVALDEMQARFPTEWKGNVTGWNNRDWVLATLPSIKALGISVRDLSRNDQYVKVTKKPNGKFYDKKVDGVKTGEKKELTDFLFVKIFESEEACRADYLATKAGDPVSAESAADFPAAGAPAPAPQAAPQDAILLKFAKAIIDGAAKQAPGDLAKITELASLQIANNPMLAKRYTMESQEILELLIAAAA